MTTEPDGMAAAEPPLHVVATAGHVDHGKSALILRLTGMDPDRERWSYVALGDSVAAGFRATISYPAVVALHARWCLSWLVGGPGPPG